MALPPFVSPSSGRTTNCRESHWYRRRVGPSALDRCLLRWALLPGAAGYKSTARGEWAITPAWWRARPCPGTRAGNETGAVGRARPWGRAAQAKKDPRQPHQSFRGRTDDDCGPRRRPAAGSPSRDSRATPTPRTARGAGGWAGTNVCVRPIGAATERLQCQASDAAAAAGRPARASRSSRTSAATATECVVDALCWHRGHGLAS
jgi:hypothetical protein